MISSKKLTRLAREVAKERDKSLVEGIRDMARKLRDESAAETSANSVFVWIGSKT